MSSDNVILKNLNESEVKRKSPGRKIKRLPKKDDEYILKFLEIIYNTPVTDWDEILGIIISPEILKKYEALPKYKSEDVHMIFRDLFRIHETQKLRQEINCEKELISLLRCIGKKYGYMLNSFYSRKLETQYVMDRE